MSVKDHVISAAAGAGAGVCVAAVAAGVGGVAPGVGGIASAVAPGVAGDFKPLSFLGGMIASAVLVLGLSGTFNEAALESRPAEKAPASVVVAESSCGGVKVGNHEFILPGGCKIPGYNPPAR